MVVVARGVVGSSVWALVVMKAETSAGLAVSRLWTANGCSQRAAAMWGIDTNKKLLRVVVVDGACGRS